jgi:hypothetical protein
MSHSAGTIATVHPAAPLTVRQRAALLLLLEAAEAAQKADLDLWHFAMELVRRRMLELNDLRVLLDRGSIEPIPKGIEPGSPVGISHPRNSLVLSGRTCFLLMARGRALTAPSEAEPVQAASRAMAAQGQPGCLRRNAPYWDSGLRELWLDNCLVKRFRIPAHNQEVVLAALEEEGWPERMDDPLPPRQGIDPKVRLHDTIKALNRNQQRRCLCFQGDGSGQGIRWQVVKGV